MRSEGRIKHQLKQVIYRHLQKRLRMNFKKRPHTCLHNKEVIIHGVRVGVCSHPDVKMEGQNFSPYVVCDTHVSGGIQQAQECSFWDPVASKEDIKEEFTNLVNSGDRGRIAAECPDVAALMWVLDNQDQEVNLLDILEGDEDE